MKQINNFNLKQIQTNILNEKDMSVLNKIHKIISEDYKKNNYYDDRPNQIQYNNKNSDLWYRKVFGKYIENEYLWEYIPELFILEDHNSSLVGFVILKPISFKIGIITYTIGISKEYQNKGIGYRFLKDMYEYIFQNYRWVYKIQAKVFGYNTGSIKLHQKIIDNYINGSDYETNVSIEKGVFIKNSKRYDKYLFEVIKK